MSDREVTRTVLLDGGTESLYLRRFHLIVRADGAEQRRHTFESRYVTVGSRDDNDLVIFDPRVSRRHASIEVDARGYRVVDHDSKNGTYIGDVRVCDAFLTPGTELRFGETRVRFETTEEEVEVRISGHTSFGQLIGRSVAMREVYGVLEKVAPTDLTVLVQGRSGTGKELVAEAIHQHSARAAASFVVFDCSAVSPDLIESALFGHVKGAFTGAVSTRRGAFEEASGGTLFIDELGELSLDLQPKLLRALERREIRRVGSNEVIPVDVRIVAATNRNLQEEVAAGSFREDLYYRLAVVRVRLPPLSERPEDIPYLVEKFLVDARERYGAPNVQLTVDTMQRLQAHAWPGNVRELKNFIDRAVALADHQGDVEPQMMDLGTPSPRATSAAVEPPPTLPLDLSFKEAKAQLVESFEVSYWEQLLDHTDGNVTAAARIAGVHRKSAEYILKKLGLRDGAS